MVDTLYPPVNFLKPFIQYIFMTLRKELLDILACPKCKGGLEYKKKDEKLICNKCRLKYSIIDGDIPDMLIDDAEKF